MALNSSLKTQISGITDISGESGQVSTESTVCKSTLKNKKAMNNRYPFGSFKVGWLLWVNLFVLPLYSLNT